MFSNSRDILQLTTELLSLHGNVIEKSSQPCMLRFKSSPIQLVLTFMMGVPLVLGISRETRNINVLITEAQRRLQKKQFYLGNSSILSMLRSLDKQAKEKGGAVFQVCHLSLSKSKISITGRQDYKTFQLLSLITKYQRRHHQGDDNSLLSYPNFIPESLFVGMRPSFDHFKMFNTHRRGIRQVLDVSERNRPKTRKWECIQKSGGCVNRLLHPNFIQEPLFIASESLTPNVVESIKFREVSEGKQPKNTKMGGKLIKIGV